MRWTHLCARLRGQRLYFGCAPRGVPGSASSRHGPVQSGMALRHRRRHHAVVPLGQAVPPASTRGMGAGTDGGPRRAPGARPTGVTPRVAFITNELLLERARGLFSPLASVRREIILPARALSERGVLIHVISLPDWPSDQVRDIVIKADRVV